MHSDPSSKAKIVELLLGEVTLITRVSRITVVAGT